VKQGERKFRISYSHNRRTERHKRELCYLEALQPERDTDDCYAPEYPGNTPSQGLPYPAAEYPYDVT